MEIKKEYFVIHNAVSETINLLVDMKSEIDKSLQKLIDAYDIVTEIYINKNERDEMIISENKEQLK